MKVITVRPKNKIWMNSTLYKLSRQKHRFFAAAKRSGTTEAWQAYQRARNQCNIAFKKAKTAFMQRQQDKLTTLADGSSAWWRKAKVLARITTPVEPIPDMTNDGHTVSNQTEKAELLASFFAKQCTAPPANVTDCLNQCPAPYPLPRGQPVFEFPVIRSSTVFHHLSRLSTTKSTADKIITNRVLRECASPITESITYLFNLSIRTSKFPCDWKNAVVTPIFKRRGRESDPSNYRPVSLLPSLGKVLDAIQSEHLLSYLNSNHLLNKHQFGFLPRRSTVTQLAYVVDTWLRDLDNGNQISAIFMDFQKAFDRVWHTGLVHKLRTLGVLPNSVSWISSFLTNRTIAVRVGSCLSSQHTISAGVPQGSHLGPVLFLVFINDLPDHVNIPTELYADDALLHHTFKRSTTALSVRGELQTAVLAAEQWALQWHGRFGHTKTKQLNIGQRQNLSLATVIEDHQIEEVVRHKHLGITFTSDLKWNVHIQGVIGNAAKRAGLLRWMSHHLRGPLIAHLYLAYVRPTMEYASPLWHGSIRDEDALQLERIQAAVARRILHAPWDTPKRQLLEELNWPSLRWRREIASLCLLHQLLQERPDPLSDTLPQYASTCNTRSPRKPKELILANARTTRYSKSFFFRTSVVWNTLPGHLQQLTSPHQFKLAIREHFHAHKFNCLQNFSLTP